MSAVFITGGCKEHAVLIEEKRRKTVLEWNYDGHPVPALSQVALTLVEFGQNHCVEAHFAPETMKRRKEYYRTGGFRSESLDAALPPVCIARAQLLSKLLPALGDKFGTGRRDTTVRWFFPNVVLLERYRWQSTFAIYFNVPAFEFYHLLFVELDRARWGKNMTQFERVPPAPTTLPALIRWARRFDNAKRRMYQERGFLWLAGETPKDR